ncbi:MAG: DUF5666 domain-containing protein [Gammaproteobacteria bacterium]|nr:DUF5666 domain-containing protein [Gammaproteobacteria bacterium]
MKFLQLRKSISYGLVAITVASSVFLASCGGGGDDDDSNQSAGVGGTGIVAGKTTGFGSIYVNGSKYETDMSQFIVDGESAPNQPAANLQLGMYVKLKVETLDGNFTNKALEVVYDDEVQGPVTGISGTGAGETQRTFTVYGQTITIDETATIYNNTTFEGLVDGRLVEISGFRTAPDSITATYLEDKGEVAALGSEVELRGFITGYTAGSPETFGIVTATGITITADGSESREPLSLVLQNGVFVEVEGTYVNATSILATKVEEEDEDFDDDVDDISLQGVVSDIASGISNFLIGTQRVDASGIAGLVLMDGMNIEVEGEIVAGKLIADEVEFRDDDTKLRTFVNNVEPGDTVFHVNYLPLGGTVTVRTDGQTLFEDETGAVLSNPPFSVDDLAATDFVRVEGQEIGGEVIASVVKRVNGTNEDLRLEGAVDSHVDNASITILGIEYAIDPNPTGTSFEGFVDSAAFFLVMDDGDLVEIEDDFPADGIADEVELE